jgi:hypothetical protein
VSAILSPQFLPYDGDNTTPPRAALTGITRSGLRDKNKQAEVRWLARKLRPSAARGPVNSGRSPGLP